MSLVTDFQKQTVDVILQRNHFDLCWRHNLVRTLVIQTVECMHDKTIIKLIIFGFPMIARIIKICSSFGFGS